MAALSAAACVHGAPQQLVNVLRSEETPAVTQVEVTRLAQPQRATTFDVPTVARLLPIPQRTVAVQAEPQTLVHHAAGQFESYTLLNQFSWTSIEKLINLK